jgi:hypothetical protein
MGLATSKTDIPSRHPPIHEEPRIPSDQVGILGRYALGLAILPITQAVLYPCWGPAF